MGLLWRFYQRFLRYKGALLLGFAHIPLAQGAVDSLSHDGQLQSIEEIFLSVVGREDVTGTLSWLEQK